MKMVFLRFIIGFAIGSILMHGAIQQGWVNATPQETSTDIQQ